MKLEKGLYSDSSETDQPQGTYRFAKNIVESNVLGAKENEEGFQDLATVTPYDLIGSVSVSNDEVVVFSTNNVSSEIGLVNLTTKTYSLVYNNDELSFKTSNPIQAEFRKEVNGERVVAWTDALNRPRILNIDNLSGVDDVQDLTIFQEIDNPEITSYSINDFGGSLVTSAIIPITKYKNFDGSQTSWYVHDKTFYINDDAKAEAFNLNDGAAGGTFTNKSISFSLARTDLRYERLVVGYLQIVNNITSAYEAYTTTNTATPSITITGAESTIDISLDEVLTSNTTYSTASTLTQLGGQLYFGDLTADLLPEAQQWALGIRISYTHSLVDVLSNVDSHKDALAGSFMPGEVYAFYLGVELLEGGWVYYHIPGRDMNSSERETVVDSDLGLTYKRFQVINTADNGSFGTNMSGWENENEVYPNDDRYDGSTVGYTDLRGEKVRHHRFPTLVHLIDTYYSGDATVGVSKLPHLGITVENVLLGAAIQNKISRWKIFYAKKTSANSLVLGSDLYQPGVPTDADPTMRWSTGGNWRLEAEATDGGTPWLDFAKPEYDTIRGHSLDYFYDSSTPPPTYAWFQYMLSRTNLAIPYTGFRSPGCQMSVTGEDVGQMASAVIDYTVDSATTRGGAGSFMKRLDNFTYLPPNALNGKFKSQYTEGVYVADILNWSGNVNIATPVLLLTNSKHVPPDDQQFRREIDAAEDPTIAEKTFYMQYYKYLTDVHTSFTQQDLVPTEGYGVSGGSLTLTTVGGDTFLNYMSFLTMAPLNAQPEGSIIYPFIDGVRIWRGYVGYSRRNFNYRYQEQGNLGTYYHGKADVRTLMSPTFDGTLDPIYTGLIDASQSHNIVKYDSSMNFANILSGGIIFSTDLVQASSFPNTIIWSIVQNEESKEFSWRSFPAGNRYTMAKNKGRLVNLQGMKNKELVLHTEYAIFRTRTDANVQAENENIFFRSANLFELPPEELVPTITGYGGTQHKFSCTLTKMGYVYVDNVAGKIFVYTGQNLEEISAVGTRIFFRDFMGVTEDNPYIGNGYSTGFDERYNRLLVTKNNGSTSWTASFNPVKKTWISYHDYLPDVFVNTLGGSLYSVKDNNFFRNSGGAKGVYYDATIYPSYIDVTFDSPRDKQFDTVSWVTEIYPNTFITGQPNSTLDYSSTCTHITLRSADNCTGRILIVPFTELDSSDTSNARNLNRTWYFNDLRDITVSQGFVKGFYDNFEIDTTKLNTSMEWYDRRKFLDKFLTCRIEYDNTVNNRFLLLEADTTYDDVKR